MKIIQSMALHYKSNNDDLRISYTSYVFIFHYLVTILFLRLKYVCHTNKRVSWSYKEF